MFPLPTEKQHAFRIFSFKFFRLKMEYRPLLAKARVKLKINGNLTNTVIFLVANLRAFSQGTPILCLYRRADLTRKTHSFLSSNSR